MKIPILRLGEILLTSIQVDLTDAEVMQFQTEVLHTIADTEARGLALDITAM
ncbi:MAG TPA: anti-anti-sigma factor, partial [Gammaproteobacteria bacterium]|nr:anti-anti-sigma factor [Gammaproteobacteria bacterium]